MRPADEFDAAQFLFLVQAAQSEARQGLCTRIAFFDTSRDLDVISL
jgi:hypothetical protein